MLERVTRLRYEVGAFSKQQKDNLDLMHDSNRDTHLYPQHNKSSVHLTITTHVGTLGGSPMECRVGGQPHKTPHFVTDPDTL